MATPYTRSQKSSIKPLFFKTPIYADESIASWLIRAAFRQGCSITTFTSYYWAKYRLWTLDVDRGFNNVDGNIHEDMALLAETTREYFDHHNLVYLTNNTTKSFTPGKTRTIPWVLPLAKRNRHSLYGYYYCPICLERDKVPYLRLIWRYSWYTYCHVHAVKMENRCHSCGALFQPNLLTPQLKMLNCCHSCHKKVTQDYIKNPLFIPETYEIQKQAMMILQERQVNFLGTIIDSAEWFELVNFFIALTKQAARHVEKEYKIYKLFNELGIDTSQDSIFSLKDSDTGYGFELLPIHERIRFLRYAKMLLEIPLDKWISACTAVEANQNSFMLNGKKSVIPKGFLPVYNQLPINNGHKRKILDSDKPASLSAVKKSWARLQRRAIARGEYEQNITRN